MSLSVNEAIEKGLFAQKSGNLDEAMFYFHMVLDVDKQNAAANFGIGVMLLSKEEARKAMSFFKIAAEAEPRDAKYWQGYIVALLKAGEIDQAKEVLEYATQLGVHNPGLEKLKKNFKIPAGVDRSIGENLTSIELNKLGTLFSENKFKQVISYAEELLKREPNAAQVWNLLGAAAANLGDPTTAIDAFKKGIAINPDYAEAYNNLGAAFQELGDGKNAIEAFRHAIRIKPNYAQALKNLGIAKHKNLEREASLDFFKRALSVNPKYSDAYNNMGVVLQDMGSIDDAINAYKSAIEINPNYAEAYSNLGTAFQMKAQYDDAVEAFTTAISIKPDYADAYNNLGNVLREKENFSEALKAYARTLELDPLNVNAKHMYNALAGKVVKMAPISYIENVFDSYADNFESSLLHKLQYNSHFLIRDIILKVATNRQLGSVLDLGCGTGLLGALIHNFCDNLVGVDISSKMLEEARRKNVYNNLYHEEILEFIKSETLTFDYITAADVFVYIGDLDEIFKTIKNRNDCVGRFAFTTEHADGSGYRLTKSGRFTHSFDYIQSLSQKYGYSVAHFSKHNIRKEKGNFIIGGLYLLTL